MPPVIPNPPRTLDRTEIRMLQSEHAFALELVRRYAAELQGEIRNALLNADQAFTPGRLSQSCGCLEAARQRALAARETLDRFGITPDPSA